MRQQSLFDNGPSMRFQKIIKEYGEVYTNPTMLRSKVEQYIERVLEETTHNEFINIGLAKKIKDVCLILINQYEKVPPEQRQYINAAINYFLAANDEEEDLFSPLGFDDDAEIINECLKLIGKDDLTIDI